mgnify:CR=1 FL=1
MKEFNKIFMLSMAVFLVLIALQTWMFEKVNMNSAVQIFMAIMPVLPLFWSFFIFRQHYKKMDEYLQRITGEAFLWVVGLLGFITFAYGMLVMKLDYPVFNISFILPIIFGTHGLVVSLLLWIDKNEE